MIILPSGANLIRQPGVALPEAVNTTTSPHLPGYVSAAFGSLETGLLAKRLRSHLLPPLQAQKHDRRHLLSSDPGA